MTPDPFVLDLRGTILDCSPGWVHVMGILNVTPDSFSDGGLYLDVDAAVERARTIPNPNGAMLSHIAGQARGLLGR